MEILINDFASNSSLNYFEVCLTNKEGIISSSKPLLFLEVIQRINFLICKYDLSLNANIVYKLYNDQLVEINSIPITIKNFKGL